MTDKKQILYVDDEQENLIVFKSAFRRHYKVFTALSAKEGMEILEKNKDVAMVISDQRMPQMTGIEFLKITEEKHPDILKIIMTGYSDMDVIINAINSFDIFKYIPKPWNFNELKTTIDSGLEVFELKNENKRLITTLEEVNGELYKHTQILEEKVKERTLELRTRNDELMKGIEFAKIIQSAVLPDKSELDNLFTESFVLYKPKDIVSGDFYWLHNEEDFAFIVVADCTGHGAPGGLMSMIGNTLLNQIIKKDKVFQPDEILYQLNIKLAETLNRSLEVNKHHEEGMDISLCKVDRINNTVSFTCARQSPLVYSEGKIKVLKADYFSIGEKADNLNFTIRTLPITENMSVYMFTDGYADQFGGANNKRFMKSKLSELVSKLQHISLEDQKDQLNDVFESWKGDNDQIDDVLVLGFKL